MSYFINSFPGRTINVDGKPYLYFGGTSYLSLQTDAAFQKLFIKNVKKYGTNYGASRKSNVQLSIFTEAEEYLCKLVESLACITLSSGYLAGQLIANTLNTNSHTLFYAPDTHSTLHISNKKPSESFDELNTSIRSHLKNSKSTPVLLLDTIDTTGNNYPAFEALRKLPLDKVILVADDSHGIGIVESNGKGTYSQLKKLNPKELILCCSLGKGFGIQAGAIFGSKRRIQEFMNTEFFGGASPAAPAALATLVGGNAIFNEKRVGLQQNIDFFTQGLKNISRFQHLQNYPVFSFTNKQLAAHLEANNIVTTNFNYPTENGPLMSRIILSAGHTKSDIMQLLETINSF